MWVLGQDSSHVLAWQQWSMDSDYSEGRRRAPGGPAGGGVDAADSGVLPVAKLRGQKKEASSFCPFAPVESFLVAKVGINRRLSRWTRVSGSNPFLASSGYVTTRSITWATKKLSARANGQKENALFAQF